MVWDGIKRRAEDSGNESPDVILARIDERTKYMKEDLEKHVNNFNDHKSEDTKNFAGLYKWVWIGTGIIGSIQFLILAIKH